jgi:hypothetical protein
MIEEDNVPSGERTAKIKFGLRDDAFNTVWYLYIKFNDGEKYGGEVNLSPTMREFSKESDFDVVYREIEKLVDSAIRDVTKDIISGENND